MNRTEHQCLNCGRDLVQRADAVWVPLGKVLLVRCGNAPIEGGPHEPIGPDHEMWEER